MCEEAAAFMQYDLGFFDQETGRMRPESRNNPLPICSERTH